MTTMTHAPPSVTGFGGYGREPGLAMQAPQLAGGCPEAARRCTPRQSLAARGHTKEAHPDR